MNRLKRIPIVFTIILLASCSQDNAFNDAHDGPDGEGVVVTFTAAMDYSIAGAGSDANVSTQRAATRSEGTAVERPNRCYAQAIPQDGSETTGVIAGSANATGGYDFRLRLKPGVTYDFLFWADNAEGVAPDDLTAVGYTPGVVAFAAHTGGTAETASQTVTLTHIVAKVTLVTTTAVPAETSISLEYPTATSYNVLTGAVSGSSRQTTGGSGPGYPAGDEVLIAYLLPTDNRTITLTVNGTRKELTGVPLAADTHVTLQGDLSGKTHDYDGSHGGFTDDPSTIW